MKQALSLFLFCLLLASNCLAGVYDFAEYFDVDMEKDTLPTIEELNKTIEKYNEYNKKYNNYYDLVGEFDRDFYITISTYGMQEKRLKGESEDLYIEFLSLIPKKYYQYLGPQLFEVPNMSEKVLNLPGIKETKNQFPTRIAEQVKDIEDLITLMKMFFVS